MPTNSLLNLLLRKLPRTVSQAAFLAHLNAAELDQAPQKAMYDALKTFGQLDWQAYLENNKDVKDSGVDPVAHFLNDGLFEGRAIYALHYADSQFLAKCADNLPKVSIILPNYNNSAYLPRSLNSLISQTLEDIEIIVVDDGSTDNSAQIIKSYLEKDPRIKLIEFPSNMGTHLARKAGVMASCGRYIMFLDPDDFYAPSACEIAYNNAVLGFDIVHFGCNFIKNYGNQYTKEATRYYNFCNPKECGIYLGDEILEHIYISPKLDILIWNRIYASHICKLAFSKMVDEVQTGPEDNYESLVIATTAKSMKLIEDKLYFYTYGGGISFCGFNNNKILQFCKMGNVMKPIYDYCKMNGLMRYYEKIKLAMFNHSFGESVRYASPNHCQTLFESHALQYGILYTLVNGLNLFFDNIKLIAEQFSHFHVEQTNKSGKIGIFLRSFQEPGTVALFRNLKKTLLPAGYAIYLYLENREDFASEMCEQCVVRYIHPSIYSHTDMASHLSDMYYAVRDADLECMLYLQSSEPALFWDTMLLKLLNIPVISFLDHDYDYYFNRYISNYSTETHLTALRCSDKVICLSIYSEIYLRTNGVDAEYLPNGIEEELFQLPENTYTKTIAFIGRLDDPNRGALEALNILNSVLEEISGINMLFIGDFVDDEAREEFYEKAKELDLLENIHVMGWVQNLAAHLSRCNLLLVTSRAQSFHNGILEAQACGLPVIMYKLPIMQALDNESIISVAQNDSNAAAREIIALLENDERWKILSNFARDKAKRFNFSKFNTIFEKLFNAFCLYSNANFYTHQEYRRIIQRLNKYECDIRSSQVYF